MQVGNEGEIPVHFVFINEVTMSLTCIAIPSRGVSSF